MVGLTVFLVESISGARSHPRFSKFWTGCSKRPMVSTVTSTKDALSFDLSIRNNSERVKFLRRRSKERGFLLLRFRRVLFGPVILILVSGILLFAITIFH